MRPYSRYTSRFDTTDAQTVRPYSRYTSRFDTTDAQTVRPYSRYTSRFVTTDALPLDTHRASLHQLVVSSDESDDFK